jgi:hypothetical protein
MILAEYVYYVRRIAKRFIIEHIILRLVILNGFLFIRNVQNVRLTNYLKNITGFVFIEPALSAERQRYQRYPKNIIINGENHNGL